jgi:hypothetical protein
MISLFNTFVRNVETPLNFFFLMNALCVHVLF